LHRLDQRRPNNTEQWSRQEEMIRDRHINQALYLPMLFWIAIHFKSCSGVYPTSEHMCSDLNIECERCFNSVPLTLNSPRTLRGEGSELINIPNSGGRAARSCSRRIGTTIVKIPETTLLLKPKGPLKASISTRKLFGGAVHFLSVME
jgi:hypothetical protein